MKLTSSVFSSQSVQASKALVFGAALAMSAVHSQATCISDPFQARVAWTMPVVGADRFATLANFNCQAVLDRNTGLVWEQSPATQTYTWADAMAFCTTRITGGTMGWRLPTVDELGTLTGFISATWGTGSGPTSAYGLPAGHPFGAASGLFWSSTNWASDSASAWIWQQPWNSSTLFTYPAPLIPRSPMDVRTKTTQANSRAWCVRGS